MVLKGKLSNIGDQASSWVWQRRFNKTYASDTGLKGDGTRLRIVAGVCGSRIEWLSDLLRRCAPSIRFFNEPLERIDPEIVLSKSADRLALPYQKELEPNHPLVRTLRMLTEKDNFWSKSRSTNRITEAETDWQACLVKEHHSLLASEALIRMFQAPTLFLVRDPVRTADRIFKRLGKQTNGYLDVELESMRGPVFLTRFLPNEYKPVLRALHIIEKVHSPREKRILRLVLAIALLNLMFRRLDVRYQHVTTIAYEQLFIQPKPTISRVASFMGGTWEDNTTFTLMESIPFPESESDSNASPVGHMVRRQLEKPFQILTVNEAIACRQLMVDCGLSDLETAADLDDLDDKVTMTSQYLCLRRAAINASRKRG